MIKGSWKDKIDEVAEELCFVKCKICTILKYAEDCDNDFEEFLSSSLSPLWKYFFEQV